MNDPARKPNAQQRNQLHPNRRPKDAATLIIVDRAGSVPKVLLGKRHHKHAFMPGKFVFPGGRAEPHDRTMAVASPLNPQVETCLMRGMIRPSKVKARALALAAIRETFEETGLLLGAKRPDGPKAPDGPWAEFAASGLYPDLSSLHFIARAITPPGRPRRFDTRFFTVDATAIAHRIDNVVHSETELVELTWIPISDARQLDMPTITAVVLEELEARVAAGFGHDLPVPYYCMPHKRFVRALL